MKPVPKLLRLASCLALAVSTPVLSFAADSPFGAAVQPGESVQDAIDQNPGRPVFVPAGDHLIHDTLRLRTDHSGLWGPGRIVQTNPEAAIIELRNLTDVSLRDLTFTRSEGRMETHRAGVFATNCNDVTFSNLRVIDNRGDLASVYLRACIDARVLDCRIENYSRISVDDRRRRPDEPNFDVVGGYAFNTISGTGLGIRACQSVLVRGNRIIERVMIPSPELQKKYKLGSFCARDATKGSGLPQKMWDAGYNNGWHQGSAIAIGNRHTDAIESTNRFAAKDPTTYPTAEIDHYLQIVGNYIENAAQGMDIHDDHVIVADNIVNNAFMGMKAVHGARNVIITGNQFSRIDLWGILLMPGSTSHAAHAAEGPDKPAEPANIDGHSIVANNIISDFGYGHAHFMWKNGATAPLRFNANGYRKDVPPLSGVLVQGNVVYDTGRDQILVDGKPRVEPPRYKHAVFIETGADGPVDLHFANNLLDPGINGVSNTPLP